MVCLHHHVSLKLTMVTLGWAARGVAMTILTFVSVLSVGVSIGYVIAGVLHSGPSASDVVPNENQHYNRRSD
jgi:hypothetical protein